MSTAAQPPAASSPSSPSSVPVENEHVNATSAAFALSNMESTGESSTHDEERFYDAEDGVAAAAAAPNDDEELATAGPASDPQRLAPATKSTRATSSSRSPRSCGGTSSSSAHHAASDLRDDEPTRELANLPPIPPKLLPTGRPASVALFPTTSAASPVEQRPALRRAASAAGARSRPPPGSVHTIPPPGRRHAIRLEPSRDAHQQKQQGTPNSRAVELPAISRRRARAQTVHTNTLSTKTTSPILLPSTARANMDFYELHTHHQRSPNHTSAKRRSFPADVDFYDRRPSTSYSRPSSRLNTNRSADLQRHTDQYKSPTRGPSYHLADSASVSGHSNSGPSGRYSLVPDRSPLSPTRLRERLHSPELPLYPRRRPSFGAPISSALQHNQMANLESSEESPAEESEPKLSESNSAESQQDDNVWDELDELKSRIKELEMNDKVPRVSSTAASGNSSDRPRTATTAPTTIDSSPKHERKRESERKKATPTPPPETPTLANALSTIHPPLHAALAKAQTLLNAPLYRTLEAASNDALQLAAITGSGGPQGTTFSAASIINGLTVSDRQLRRKVDNMCRNLTELAIALCEGKHEPADIVSSPTSMDTARQESPSFRYSESVVPTRSASNARPVSRLEARKSSILGGNSLVPYESISPRGSIGDTFHSEQEPMSPKSPKSIPPQLRRISRAPSGLRSRTQQRQDEVIADDSSSLRPPSRAMTDIGGSRTRSRLGNENRSPVAQRTPSLREILASRRNDEVFEANRETPRIASLGSDHRRRRLFDQQSTPPVREEEEDVPDDYHTPSQPPRRVTSLGGQFSKRRSIGDMPGRTSSLHQRRHVITE